MKKKLRKKKTFKQLIAVLTATSLFLSIAGRTLAEEGIIQKINEQNNEDISVSEAIEVVEENLEDALPESDGVLKKEKNQLVLKDNTPNDGNKVSLPINGTGKIEMTSVENGTTKIDLPDDGKTGQATMINESTVVYANTAVGVDTVVTVPGDNNIETYHIIRSSESPKRYEYKMTIPQGGRLEQMDDSRIAVLNGENLPEMIVSAPSAKDAKGAEVPLKLIIEENRIVLFVDHNEKFVYPIMADPKYLGVSMNNAEWKFCINPKNWGICDGAGNILAGDAKNKAEEIAKKYKWSLHNGGADAFRHCYWSGLMTSAYGTSVAKGFGDRHEEDPGQPKKEKDMDLNNNKKGRDWVSAKEGIKERCIKGVKNGELKILTSKP